MKKIIDYLFYRYYLISIKNEEFPRFGATCVLAEVVTMVYLFAALILSFLLTGDFFLPSTSGRTRIKEAGTAKHSSGFFIFPYTKL